MENYLFKKAKTCCLFLFIFFLFFQANTASASRDIKTGAILSDDLVSKLIQNCDTEEIFLKAWAPNVNMDTVTSDKEREIEKQLKKEITQILRSCLNKEIKKIDCSKVSCADVDSGLRELRENIFAKYFLDDKNMWDFEAGYEESLQFYQQNLAVCYETIFKNCDCNIDGLTALWADLNLNNANPFNPYKAATKANLSDEIDKVLRKSKLFRPIEKKIENLIHAIEKKIEECLKTRIAKMTNVWELERLVFKDKRDEYGNRTIRDDTIYNNYNIAKAILKRLISLYELEDFINLDDEYFNSSCCDRLLFLKYFFSIIDSYNLMDWPELTRKERQLSSRDFVEFLQRIKVAFNDPDAYTFCRKLMFDELISYGENCDVNKFCQALRCKEHKSGILFQRKAVEKQLVDPREREFLNYFKRKLKECSGVDIDLEDFIDFCFKLPANKSWEELRKEAEDADKEKEIEKDFERIDKFIEEALDKTTKKETAKKGLADKKEEFTELDLKGGSVDIAKLLPITKDKTKKIRITLPSEAEFHKKDEDQEEKYLKVKLINVDDSDEIIQESGAIIELRNNRTVLIEENVEAKVEIPIIIKENKIYAGEEENLQAVNLLPSKIKNYLEIAPNEIYLKEDKDKNPVYIVKLEEKQKLFGFLPIKFTIKREIKINPFSGKLLSIKQPWWAFLFRKSRIPKTFL